jgi:hypothetical protein
MHGLEIGIKTLGVYWKLAVMKREGEQEKGTTDLISVSCLASVGF